MRNIIEYHLEIETANKRYAGTDNDVFITVYGKIDGEEVSTGEINLSKRVNGNAFEKGDKHSLDFQWEDIGRPLKIKLRLSNDLLDDWQFRRCTIKRNGHEKEDLDSEINKEVVFDGKDTVFSRKDSKIFYGNLDELYEEIESVKTYAEFDHFKYITLAPNNEQQINMSFTKETTTSIQKSVVEQNGITHTLGVQGDIGYAAANTGGVQGKGDNMK